MCGIFGWVKPRMNFTHSLDLDIITRKGMIATMVRGKDATGFYCPTLGVNKQAVSADKYPIPSVKHDRFYIGHCRAASVGSAFVDENAHPFSCEHLTLVHNGTSRDVKELKDYEYEGQTDSEIVLSYIHKYGVKEGIERSGATGALVINDRAKNRLYFWNDGSRTLELCRYRGLVFFASTRAILRTALNINKVMGIFDDANWYRIDDRELTCFDMYKSRNKFSELGATKETKTPVKVFKYGGNSNYSSNYGVDYTPSYAPPSYNTPTVDSVADAAAWDGAADEAALQAARDEANIEAVRDSYVPPNTRRVSPYDVHSIDFKKKHTKHPKLAKDGFGYTNRVPQSHPKLLPRSCGPINPPSSKIVDMDFGRGGVDV